MRDANSLLFFMNGEKEEVDEDLSGVELDTGEAL